ncbi:MAG TPA: hypothetical protein VHW23_26870 [Kofleriaceae bacterium]|jgi:hypothetical protein|nr:hypothetical protein [Kofleriaceae bacterium]
MSDLTKAVDMVRQARMDSWQQMAKQLPDHHVLAVEMFRIDRDRTVAVFTLVRNGRVVQEVLQGDGRGLNVRPVAPRATQPCPPLDLGRQFQVEALMMPDAAPTLGDAGVVASVAVGDPPPKVPVEPGIVAVGGVGLQNSFDTGEIVTADSPNR